MRVIVTGGPGAGKTTLLEALKARGHAVAGDSARDIIRARRAQGLPPRPSPVDFGEAILSMDLERYHRAPATGLAFFDRGIPDALALLAHAQPGRRDELITFAHRHPYHPTVFCLPPWRAIYVQDDERDHPFEHACRVHDALLAWYAALGHEVVLVPEGPVEARVRSVLTTLGAEP